MKKYLVEVSRLHDQCVEGVAGIEPMRHVVGTEYYVDPLAR